MDNGHHTPFTVLVPVQYLECTIVIPYNTPMYDCTVCSRYYFVVEFSIYCFFVRLRFTVPEALN